MPNLIPPPHPGETILEDVLKPLNMSVDRLAKALGVLPLPDSTRIVRGKLRHHGRHGAAPGAGTSVASPVTSPDFWLGLQLEYDLRIARQAKQKEIERAVQPRSDAAA